MEYTQEQVDVLNAEKAIEEQQALNLTAAKQLLMELSMLKRRIYASGTIVNSVLVVQIKQVLRGLIKKYNEAGLLIGENVTLVLSNRTKHANIGFAYSPGLQLMMRQVEGEVLAAKDALMAAQTQPQTIATDE